MKLSLTDNAKKGYSKLSYKLQLKTDKQLEQLLINHRHPSLRTKKMKDTGYFEGRIDYHYRFRFVISDETIFIISIGPHDEGLGKK